MKEPLTGDAYWEMLERAARRVDAWPSWKKGERSTRRMQDPVEVTEVTNELIRDLRVMPDAVWVRALHDHWLFSIECLHSNHSDTSHCNCGWRSSEQDSVGGAVDAYIQHVREKL